MAWLTPDWSDDDVTRTFVRPQPDPTDPEWTAPTLEIPPDPERSDWALTLPRPVPRGPAAPLPLPRVALPSRVPVPPLSPFPRVAPPPPPRAAAMPALAPLPRPPSVPRIAPPPPRRSAPPPPRRSAQPSAGSLPPLPTFAQQAEAHFPPPSQQLRVEPAVVVHRTSPPAAPDRARSAPTSPPTSGVQYPAAAPDAVQSSRPPPPDSVHASTPPPPGAVQAAAPQTPALFSLPPAEPRRPRLSNVALTFIAFYLVAGAVLAIVLVARHGSSQAPNVTASDTQKHPISIASVFVDGHEVCGALPCQLPESSGSHWVSIRAAGYATPDPVEVTGSVPVHFTLRKTGASPTPAAPPAPATSPALSATTKPAPSATAVAKLPEEAPSAAAPAPAHQARRTYWHPPAKLSFYSRPSALVLLDGRPLGSTPRLGVKVSPGHHSVLFVLGGRRVARSAWAARGHTRAVSAHF